MQRITLDTISFVVIFHTGIEMSVAKEFDECCQLSLNLVTLKFKFEDNKLIIISRHLLNYYCESKLIDS